MLTLEKLRAYGANVNEGLQRCINNENLYIRLVEKAIRDPNFDYLKEIKETEDLKRGFEIAHALKGVLSNLSITPILNPICELTEIFRNQTDGNYKELIDLVSAKHSELLELCELHRE